MVETSDIQTGDIEPGDIEPIETRQRSRRDRSPTGSRRERRPSSSKKFSSRAKHFFASPKRIHSFGATATVALLPLIATTLMIQPNADRNIEVSGKSMRLDDAWTLLSAGDFWRRQRKVQHDQWQTSLASLNETASQDGLSSDRFETLLRDFDRWGLVKHFAAAETRVDGVWTIHEQPVDFVGSETEIIDFLNELNRTHPNCRPVSGALHSESNEATTKIHCRVIFRFVSLSPEALS